MEALLIGRIAESANTLGLPLSGPRVMEARRIGFEALAAGYDLDEAFDLARQVLLENFRVHDVTAA